MAKTNINLIVNGTKVYTRKTTGRPYTHAMVVCFGNSWEIVSCSSNGPAPLQRELDKYAGWAAEYTANIAAGAEAYACKIFKVQQPNAEQIEAAAWNLRQQAAWLEVHNRRPARILPIIDNTVTVTA